jgi:hypothetical protein
MDKPSEAKVDGAEALKPAYDPTVGKKRTVRRVTRFLRVLAVCCCGLGLAALCWIKQVPKLSQAAIIREKRLARPSGDITLLDGQPATVFLPEQWKRVKESVAAANRALADVEARPNDRVAQQLFEHRWRTAVFTCSQLEPALKQYLLDRVRDPCPDPQHSGVPRNPADRRCPLCHRAFPFWKEGNTVFWRAKDSEDARLDLSVDRPPPCGHLEEQ